MLSGSTAYLVKGAGDRRGAEGKQEERLAMVSERCHGTLTCAGDTVPEGQPSSQEFCFCLLSPRGQKGKLYNDESDDRRPTLDNTRRGEQETGSQRGIDPPELVLDRECPLGVQCGCPSHG